MCEEERDEEEEKNLRWVQSIEISLSRHRFKFLNRLLHMRQRILKVLSSNPTFFLLLFLSKIKPEIWQCLEASH